MMTRIDLNSDLGERDSPDGRAIDAALMPLITSVNIACGGHAGTPTLMRRTAQLAAEHGVAIGAHPGLPDPEHFGRREQSLSPQAVTALVIEQIGTLAGVLALDHLALTHVKPHGALYNMAAEDPDIAQAVVTGLLAVDRTLLLYALAGSVLIDAGRNAGLTVVSEAFADRAYRANGRLVPRSAQHAVIAGEEAIRCRLRQLIVGSVTSIDGETVPIHAETLCIHADTLNAVSLARVIRDEFTLAGVRILTAQKTDA